MAFMNSSSKTENTLSSKHLINKCMQTLKPPTNHDPIAAGDILSKATTPPLTNIADVSDAFLVNLVQALDHDTPYIQMPSAHSGEISTPIPKIVPSKSLLPEMTIMYEEDYIGSEYHDFTSQDSNWYQREGSEFEYLTNAMLTEHLRIGSALEGVISGRVRELIDGILDFSENITRWRYGTTYEALSGLRYWEMNTDGTRSLFKEWVELLAKTDYLKWTPPEVQDFFNALSEYQKYEAAGLCNLKTRKFPVNPNLPSPPVRSSRKRKIISDDGEDEGSIKQERIKRTASTLLKTQRFTGLSHTEEFPQCVQNNVFADLVNPQILATTQTGSLPNALSRQKPMSVPAFAFPPKSSVASAPSHVFYATSPSTSSQASPLTSPAANLAQSIRHEFIKAHNVPLMAISESQQQSVIPTVPLPQHLIPVVPTPTTQDATRHQGTAGVSSQPILPISSPLPVYAPTSTLRSAGIERYPWTQVRQRMWMLKNKKTAADLPAEAFRATYNPAHTGTPENGNPRLLGHMHVTICEVLTYFPLSPTIREIAYRLAQAHWEASDIIKYIFWTRNITDNNAIKRSTIHRMLDSGKKWAIGKNVQATAELGGLDLASGLTGYGAELIDVPLVSLADNVANHPTGQDAGILTQCIARCRINGDEEIMMNGAEKYARLHGIRDNYAHLRNKNVRTEDEDALGRIGQASSTWFRAAGLRLK